MVTTVVLAFFGLLVLRWLTTPTTLQKDSTSEPVLQGPVVGLDDVRASGAVERTHLVSEERTGVWLNIENTGDKPITTLQIGGFDALGLKPVGPCWRNAVPVCASGFPAQPVTAKGTLRLDAGADLSLWGELEAIPDNSKPVGIAATLVWSRQDEPKQSLPATQPSQPVVVPPPAQEQILTLQVPFPQVNILPSWKRALRNFSDSFYQVARDFALPILAIVLSLVFQRIREKEKEERDRLLEKDAQVRETWNQMLPIVHKNAQRFYMPIWATAKGFLDEFDGYWKRFLAEEPDETTEAEEHTLTKDEKLDRLYFQLMLFYVNMLALSNEVGGFYLKSRLGEDVLDLLWELFRARFMKYFKYEKIAYLADRIDPRESIAQFLSRGRTASDRYWLGRIPRLLTRRGKNELQLTSHQVFRDVRQSFCNWLSMKPEPPLPLEHLLEHISLLDIFVTVLDYEMNLPYAFWYKDNDERRLPAKDCQDRIEKLQCRPGDSASLVDRLKVKATKYFESRTTSEDGEK